MLEIRRPFFIVNPKSYLYGDDSMKMAKIADKLAKKYDIDCLFTGQLVDLPRIAKETDNLIITAQHMDSLVPGRGMGHVLPEGLVNAGIQAVVLNHAEKPLTIAELDATIKRAKSLGLITIVCADTVEQCKAIAELGPDCMICEPDSLIGTGNSSNEDYISETNKAVKSVNKNILIMQAAGVSTAADVEKVMKLGADGTGGTSGIIKAPSWEDKIDEMMSALVEFKK